MPSFVHLRGRHRASLVRDLFLVLLLTLLASARLASASQANDKKEYRAVRVEAPPAINGLLDDRCWAAGRWEGGFTQREPYEGQSPTEETDFQIAFDDENLYVAIRAHDREPDRIESRVTRRDNGEGDQVELYLDSYFDNQTAFAFNVSSAGVKSDFVVTGDGAREDESWDAVWHARVHVGASGWTAEMAIPFNQLRFGTGEPRVWGLQVRRRLHRREELSDWQFVPKDASGFVHWFGELHGLDNVPSRRQVEILPYAVAKTERYEADSEDPFSTGGGTNVKGGVDGKVAATSDLTVTFTANPDFGQVEADPSVVNLTTFETFFPEKRPFFIEGANIFDYTLQRGDGPFSRDNIFYSRRIGRAPQRSLDLEDGEYLDQPSNTTIVGAAKLTGKTHNGWSIGILDALTAAEYGTIDQLGARQKEVVEPQTNYLVGRVQRDFRKGNTILGGVFTATTRAEGAADVSLLHRTALTGGIDFHQSFRDRSYAFDVTTVFSDVRGTAETILETQRSALRYFQRPDADYLEVDPNRTSLEGHGGTMQFGKEGGGHLRFNVGATWRSPGLELNDVGYLRSADQIMQWSYVGWRIWQPFSIFRTFNVNLNQWRGWDFGGENLFDGGNVNVNFQLRSYWFFGVGFNRDGESLSNNELRGGPSLRLPGAWSHWFNLRSDRRRRVGFYLGGWNYWGDGGWERITGLWLGVTLRPVPAASISLEPTWNRHRRDLQYVDTIDLDPDERYVFGSLDQETFGLTIRLSYSITPDLSIQYYGQPFFSSGAYDELERITAPRADRFEDRYLVYAPDEIDFDVSANEYHIEETGGAAYRVGNPDFDFRQLRSNLVLRWEYTPGSTFYLVWSQDRTGDDPTGGVSLGEGFRELYRIAPYNVFLAKLSYRFAL